MNNLICIPTGKKLEELMRGNNLSIKKYYGRFNLDGLELTMAHKERTYELKLNKEDINWIKDLDYVSIHGPFYINKDSKQEKIKHLDALYSLYDKLNAKTMLFHVHECPYDLLDNYSWNVILENMPKKENLNNEKMTNIIKKSKYGFCLDTTHAYTQNKCEIEKLYNLLEPKLKQMHLSAAFRQKEHRKLSTATKSFMNSLKPVLKSNVPLILEINKINWDDKTEVNNEIKFVKKLFN
jgi:endonuclease IV